MSNRSFQLILNANILKSTNTKIGDYIKSKHKPKPIYFIFLSKLQLIIFTW